MTPGTPDAPDTPAPQPLRFFGTTWLTRDRTYAIRRTAVAATALLAAAAGALVLVLACQGLAAAEGGLVNVLLVAVTAVCSATAFRRTWSGFAVGPDTSAQGPRQGPQQDPQQSAPQGSQRGFMAIGFLGVLLAYAVRCAVEAPGERLHRAEYERARAEHARRTARRTGNPATRTKKRKK
ncbi:EamA/RhaT family transporter [Streptomyces sp. TS71-3]|uniref:EamA/RhaT family transporter n=1 Tax=Streptomyces sp. TS71-3 TaxID=2733862 RepID=UPI001B01EF37|nr:EamA/RhaT family transporter [Streptomyces sp. TS71-3]GHJ34729.1 membrane protein [Streptomyces sp. TS71-3]